MSPHTFPALRKGLAVALLTGCTLLTATLVPGAVAATTGPRVDDAVCDAMHTLRVPADESARAEKVMAGTVEMGHYGTMQLAADPDWAPQPTLDTAGDRYINSLHWALPLLREGTRSGDPAAAARTARFVGLLRDWVADHPAGSRGRWVNHPQYAGFRLGTWVCAHRLLTDPADRAWVAAQLRVDLAVLLRGYTLRGANNTMLNGQLAALAAAHEAGTPAQRASAAAHLSALRAALVMPDGSDVEGAPGYGAYLSEILVRTARVLAAYGRAAEAADTVAVIARQADFLVQSGRPDRRIESIGDGELKRLRTGVFPPSSPATWVATAGASGERPSTLYSTWQGGYVFGRSGWRAGTRDDRSTFYSVRSGSYAPLTAHRHLDTTGVTFFADGVSWIGDPGPYRYDGSALRAFITRRAAHSALVAPGGSVANAAGILRHAGSTRRVDKTCVQDTAYQATSGVQLLRCVYYLRRIDALVVQDFARTTGAATTVQQQWLLSPQVTAADMVRSTDATRLRLGGVTAGRLPRSATVLTTGTATVSAAGATLGVFGTSYGSRAAGTVASVALPVRAGGATASATTVIAPGTEELQLSSRPLLEGLPLSGTVLTVRRGDATQSMVTAADGFGP